MSELETVLRNLLDRTVVQARDVAEEAARVALQRLCVDAAEPHSALSPEERALRRALRAKMRQDGGWEALVSECAYEHWHRRLFARFLAENHLLMHPEGVAVTLEECEELAPEEGAADGWALAGRYASRMLPAIFRPDDPLLAVTLAPEHQQALDRLLAELPAPVFAADDSLGWVYQFWQAKRKKEVNESGDKIDASTIGPVTQLFTEHYMVQFLLHNTLGAWWFSRHPGEQMPVEMPYLRFTEEGKPAAGEFPGWPDTAAELRLLDPCAGSAHFLVAGFKYLRCFRMVEEGLGEAAAGDAVLRDNLFGLEIDNRCVQIAAFNLALAAWKAGGYRELPALHLACSGTPVAADVREWLALANGDERLSAGMRHLHRLFSQAPDLGSLIDPTQHQSTLEQAGYVELQPLLAAAMEKEKARRDDSLHFAGVAAEGIARAAEILAGRYNLVATNVPYLGRRDRAGEVGRGRGQGQSTDTHGRAERKRQPHTDPDGNQPDNDGSHGVVPRIEGTGEDIVHTQGQDPQTVPEQGLGGRMVSLFAQVEKEAIDGIAQDHHDQSGRNGQEESVADGEREVPAVGSMVVLCVVFREVREDGNGDSRADEAGGEFPQAVGEFHRRRAPLRVKHGNQRGGDQQVDLGDGQAEDDGSRQLEHLAEAFVGDVQ